MATSRWFVKRDLDIAQREILKAMTKLRMLSKLYEGHKSKLDKTFAQLAEQLEIIMEVLENLRDMI